METRIDQILMNYLESLLYTDELESKSVRLMLDEIRLIPLLQLENSKKKGERYISRKKISGHWMPRENC